MFVDSIDLSNGEFVFSIGTVLFSIKMDCCMSLQGSDYSALS